MRDIRTELKKIQGTGFVRDTDSLVNLAHKAGAKGTDEIHDDVAVVDGIVDAITATVNAKKGIVIP